MIRAAFIPESDDRVLLTADYSQIELRVLAHLSEDPSFVEAFHRGEHIHARTAAEVFEVPLEEVTPQQRAAATAITTVGQRPRGIRSLAGSLRHT